MKNIVLNLTAVRDAHAFKKSEEIIQWEAMEAFFVLLQDSLQKAYNFSDKQFKFDPNSRIRYHDTITVFGPRGSGKTTFILNIFDIIQRNALDAIFDVKPKDIREKFRNMSLKDVEVLEILDPTLVEQKEHVFVNILSSIKRKVDDKLGDGPEGCLSEPADVTSKSKNARRSDNKLLGYEYEYQYWVDSLRKLAAGLPALDGIGTDELKTEKWHDPVHVMEQGLRNTEASNCLEKNFHEFVARSLKLLNKKAFLLAFDDIDTQFDAGWPILEVIRKYLTTPQIITVISGDLSLYALLIRDKQWQNFSDKLLRCERPRISTFRAMVDQLEDQYLLKIMKPERRLGLKTLQEFRERKYSIEVNHEMLSEPIRLDKVLEWICKDIFFVNNEIELYRGHILSEPVRGVVQILYAYLDKFYRMKAVQPNASSKLDKFMQLDVVRTSNARQDFINTLIDVYWVPLQDMGFYPQDLKNPYARTILNTIVMTLADHSLLFQGYRLKPEHLDHKLNSAMIAVGSMLAEFMLRNPFLYFDYFIKMGIPREMSLMLPEKASNGPSLKDYLHFTGIATGEDAVTISRFSAGYSRAIIEYGEGNQGRIAMPLWQGSIALMGLAETGKTGTSVTSKEGSYISSHYNVNKWEEVDTSLRNYPREFYDLVKTSNGDRNIYSYVNRIDTLFDNINSWHKYLVTLPVSIILKKKGERLPVASVFNLIAIIGRIIECISSDNDFSDAESFFAIERILKKHSQLRDYRQPVWDAGSQNPPDSQDEEIEDEYQKEDRPIDESFLRSIWFWAKTTESTKTGLPIHILGKMTTRFSYTLSSIKDVDVQELYLGQILHRFIVAFLNAVLVEEQLHSLTPTIVSLKNPVRSDRLLFQNIKSVFGEHALRPGGDNINQSKSPFFSWIASCPLILPFINPHPNEKDQESIFSFILNLNPSVTFMGAVEYRGKSIPMDTLFPLLNSVLLQSDTSIRKQDGAPASLVDINRKMIKKDFDWLTDKIGSEMKRGRGVAINAINKGNVDGFIVELSKQFFVKYLGMRTRPRKGTSMLREQVEVFLTDQASMIIKSKKLSE